MELWLFILLEYRAGATSIQMTEAQCRSAIIEFQHRSKVLCIHADGRRLTARDVLPKIDPEPTEAKTSPAMERAAQIAERYGGSFPISSPRREAATEIAARLRATQ